jgi:hypothetical protein
MHFGMLIAGMPYTFAGQTTAEGIVGGAPYGAGTIAGADGSLRPPQPISPARASRARMWPASPPGSSAPTLPGRPRDGRTHNRLLPRCGLLLVL